jgi:hypothetical protein
VISGEDGRFLALMEIAARFPLLIAIPVAIIGLNFVSGVWWKVLGLW